MGKAHHVIGAAIFPGRAGRLGDVSRDTALSEAVHGIGREIEARRPRVLVLSTEYLWGAIPPRQVRRLLDAFPGWTPRIVAYLRRQDLLAQSLYVQAIKGGATVEFPTWLERAKAGRNAGFDFNGVLQSWASAGASVVVRVYEKGRLESDIRADFLKAIGEEAAVPVPPENRAVNTAPDMTTVELLRAINQRIADPELANRLRRRIMGCSPARPLFAPLRYLSSEGAAELLAQYAEGDARVAREFLKDPDGVLFRDPLPAVGDAAPQDLGDRALLEHLIDLLPQLVAPTARAARPRPEATAKQRRRAAEKAEPVSGQE
ncbi:hypothetical protein KTR66_03080 [Roseococcus sp. SDR]|uniref:hypothetical protein n=1 Tax=Roseococcus sp. SDR TaxID=2835532 RepID=UPI001BCDB19C|nr:hypothetical protein [Roseococcus sp. SDR]MBS7788960.1 hypothetical protein [Roseococcus sp. SDR]MBV1844274.1 hypothetical protein [Roseococcus sp. SDR]